MYFQGFLFHSACQNRTLTTSIIVDKQSVDETLSIIKANKTMRDTSDCEEQEQHPVEIALIGDMTESESEMTDRLLSVRPGGECTIYFDSPGGSPYSAMSMVGLLKLRGIRATGIVTGECSSAALWPFAACTRRLVLSTSVLLFHPMKWQSEEHIGIAEASEWSRHFSQLERDMDVLLGDLFGLSHNLIAEWIRSHRYVTGKQMLDAGLSELIGLVPLMDLLSPESKPSERDRKATKSSRRVSSARTKRSQGLRRHAGE